MDSISDSLTTYAESLTFQDLPPEVVHQAKRLWVDTLGCAIGGLSSEPARIARDLADGVSSDRPATILGSGRQTTPDLAAFANGVAIRYMDYNDTYTGSELGHPSDHLAAILAAGEVAHASGKGAIVATVLAYELFCRLCDAVIVRDRGFDYATLGTVSSVLATAKLLDLPSEQMTQALNLAVAPNIALFQTRVGDVSMWKGCAFANVSRNALFAVMLASRGLTGPSPIFEGRGGFFRAIVGGEFTLDPFGGNGNTFKVMESSMKRYPLGHLSQTVVEAAMQVRPQVPRLDEIASVEVQTLQAAIDIMAGDSQKWHPTNRETADHSMPYSTAVALMHGAVEERHFGDEYLGDPALLDLVQKVRVTASDEANRRWPEAMLSIVTVTTTSGDTYSAEVPYHRGHWKNPMSDREVEEKFHSLTDGHLTSNQSAALLDRLWSLEGVQDIGEVVRMVRVDDGKDA